MVHGRLSFKESGGFLHLCLLVSLTTPGYSWDTLSTFTRWEKLFLIFWRCSCVSRVLVGCGVCSVCTYQDSGHTLHVSIQLFMDHTGRYCIVRDYQACVRILWLTKEALYRDASWESPCTGGSALFLFFGMAIAFWSNIVLLVTGKYLLLWNSKQLMKVAVSMNLVQPSLVSSPQFLSLVTGYTTLQMCRWNNPDKSVSIIDFPPGRNTLSWGQGKVW